MNVSEMLLSDFKEIEKNFNKFDDFWSPSILEKELQNGNSKYIVAKEDDKIIGFAGLWFSVDDAHITNICVHKDYRNQGIGTKLVLELIKMAKSKDSLTLEVRSDNTIAQKIYTKLRF